MNDPSIQSFVRPLYDDELGDSALNLSKNSFHFGVYTEDRKTPVTLPETMGRFVSYVKHTDLSPED